MVDDVAGARAAARTVCRARVRAFEIGNGFFRSRNMAVLVAHDRRGGHRHGDERQKGDDASHFAAPLSFSTVRMPPIPSMPANSVIIVPMSREGKAMGCPSSAAPHVSIGPTTN